MICKGSDDRCKAVIAEGCVQVLLQQVVSARAIEAVNAALALTNLFHSDDSAAKAWVEA